MTDQKHKNYELLNLIGYGLAKFGSLFTSELGYPNKTQFYEAMVLQSIAETTGVIKNRQDLFDPFFENGRKGWWQKGDTYLHRKVLIDSLFGNLSVSQFASIVQVSIMEAGGQVSSARLLSPLMKSRFKQLQLTGREAEAYFMFHFTEVAEFDGGILEDARDLGDGYDFQVQKADQFYLAEVKGVRSPSGALRLTQNEYEKAQAYGDDFGLIVVSNLEDAPKMTALFNPVRSLELVRQETLSTSITYHSRTLAW